MSEDSSSVAMDKKKTGDKGGKKGFPSVPGRPSSANSNGTGQGGSRPASRNKKHPNQASANANNADADFKKAESDTNSNRGSGQRGRGGGRGNGAGHRKSSSSAQNGARTGGASKGGAGAPGAGPNAPPTNEGGDALQNLQRVITDLKSISPPTYIPPLSGNTFVSSASAPMQQPQPISSNLPPNAPVFQPGANAYPGTGGMNNSPMHRKAASLGSSPTSYPSNYASPLQQFQSNLGSMVEDVDEQGNTFEEGEIMDNMTWQQSGSDFPRPMGNSNQPGNSGFTAPRFAALAQQQQPDVHNNSGRPQLAPGFTFGARRTKSSLPPSMSPAIGEDDDDFQFPQAQAHNPFQQDIPPHSPTVRQVSEVTGIMAEQLALQSQIEALQQQQQQLYQQQLASSQVMQSLNSPTTAPTNRITAHRRVQSTAPFMGQSNTFPLAGMPVPNVNTFGTNQLFGEDGVLARGHGRRHSVNVINKTTPASAFSLQESFDDNFNAPSTFGHSRNPSRVDPNWRMNGNNTMQNNANLSSELAQAQAQLQSLQQFRAAAGGHHQKMASFSFPNMLPNMMAANLMGLGGMNLSAFQQQQQQFQMQLQQQSSQPQRKSLFAPYLPQASLPPLLAAGKLVVGILRVNKRNRSDAYVATEVLEADIYICGSKDRNRALEGDIVAVELLDVDEVWGTKKEKEEKKRKKEENAAYEAKSPINRKNDKKKDDVEVEGQGLMLFEDEEVTDEVKPQYAGHVVAVVERMPGQLFSGTLGLLRPSSAATKEKQEAERREREGDRAIEERKGPIERPKIVWFRPTDKRVPLIAIPTEQAPPDFVQNSESYTDKLFVACIKRHPISSLHPFGTLVEELGPIGDIEVETSALLKDCNFPTEEFSDNVLKCVPPTPWVIPEHEYSSRRDMRDVRVFTIDPTDAKDLDDAVSIQTNEDGTYDVSVHIADVAYFVKPNTALDRDARKRGTSVYLVQRSVPLLPPVLSEQLCSLLPGQERLAFTFIFTLTPDARVVNKWFGKTIIKSASRLSYDHAQDVIDGKPLANVVIAPEHDTSAVEHDVRALWNLAKQLRERRKASGILDIHSPTMKFVLDDNGLPSDCYLYERSEANKLIEEFMLLANQAAAQQVAFSLPEQALLRRHEEPIDRRLAGLVERATRLGYSLDTSNAGALTKSFDTIDNPAAQNLLVLASQKAIQRAKYFCSGMLDIVKYGHYALNVPLYTHFTSPIRRYSDIIVHRQLESIVTANGGENKFSMDRDSVAKVAQQCNIKKDSAKLAQEQSAHLYLCHLIADLTQRYGPVVRQATVVGVLDAAFDVLIPEFGIEKRVHVDQMPIENHVFDEHSHRLSIYWSTKDVITWLAENSDDEHLKKVKRNAEQHALKMEVTSRSVHDESALFDDDEDDIVFTREAPERETSKQRLLSKALVKPEFEGLRQADGHKIQDIKELMTVPVIVTADLTKSPAVIKVYSVNPYALKK